MTDTITQDNEIAALIFSQLLESPRFRTFYELNYEVRKVIDHEAKTIDYVVIERPSELVSEELGEMMKVAAMPAPQSLPSVEELVAQYEHVDLNALKTKEGDIVAPKPELLGADGKRIKRHQPNVKVVSS